MAHVHVYRGEGGDRIPHPRVREITNADLWDCLARGYDDFAAMPSHAIFTVLICPIIGLLAAGYAFGHNMLPMLFPIAAGFAIVGPIAAIGLYELSRQRETGREPDIAHAFDVLKSPSLPAILALNGILFVLFFGWLASAQAIYQSLFGFAAPESVMQFITMVSSTREGWMLVLLGNAVGLGFAALAFAVSVVSFPLLLDRDAGLAAAIMTSIRAIAKNPVPMLCWAGIVTVLLVLGSLPAFIGLAFVLPLLGHATWHLYRKLVR